MGELAELTGSPQWTVDGKLGSVFGRSLKTRTPKRTSDPTGTDDVVYLFAHETLGAVAEAILGNDLAGPTSGASTGGRTAYRERGCAGRHPAVPAAAVLDAARRQGPGRPPASWLERFPDRPSGDTTGCSRPRSVTATRSRSSPRRRSARSTEPLPDLATLGQLAVTPRPPGRSQRAPARRAARPPGPRGPARRRGEAIAKSMPMHSQPKALAAVASALRRRRPVGQAERQGRPSSPAADSRARALAWVGRAMIEADREQAVRRLLEEKAGQLARSVPDSHLRPFAIAAVAEAFAGAGLWERAEETAQAPSSPIRQGGARTCGRRSAPWWPGTAIGTGPAQRRRQGATSGTGPRPRAGRGRRLRRARPGSGPGPAPAGRVNSRRLPPVRQRRRAAGRDPGRVLRGRPGPGRPAGRRGRASRPTGSRTRSARPRHSRRSPWPWRPSTAGTRPSGSPVISPVRGTRPTRPAPWPGRWPRLGNRIAPSGPRGASPLRGSGPRP